MVSRWGLVICDEAQDTSEVQWRLLQLLAARKVILLGDPNQMIYGFVPGVSVEGFERIREWAGREIQLMPRSHRDPTGAIPAMAEAVRIRDFHNDAVVEAIKSGRLTIHFDVGEPQIGDYLRKEIKRPRALGSRDVGVFAHSNAAVFELGEALNAQRIDHAVIGIPEAHAEALNAMAVQCRFGVDLASDADVREALAIFLTAASRGATHHLSRYNSTRGTACLPSSAHH